MFTLENLGLAGGSLVHGPQALLRVNVYVITVFAVSLVRPAPQKRVGNEVAQSLER